MNDNDNDYKKNNDNDDDIDNSPAAQQTMQKNRRETYTNKRTTH